MFGLGFTELLVILGIALLVLGPKKLPEAARMLGKATAHFRKTLDEVRHDLAIAEIEEMRERSMNILSACPEDSSRLAQAAAESLSDDAEEGESVSDEGNTEEESLEIKASATEESEPQIESTTKTGE